MDDLKRGDICRLNKRLMGFESTLDEDTILLVLSEKIHELFPRHKVLAAGQILYIADIHMEKIK